MLSLGERVLVLDELDDIGHEVHGDLIGKKGNVFFLDFNHGCGEDEEGIDGQNTDPMYHVGFDDGQWGTFFEEELMSLGFGGYPEAQNVLTEGDVVL